MKEPRSRIILLGVGYLLAVLFGLEAPALRAELITIGTDDGSGGNLLPFGSIVPLYQQMYSSSFFSNPVVITGLSFSRINALGNIDVASSASNTITSGVYTFSLSTTSKPVGGLDNSNLSSNIGSDNQLFFHGSLSGTPNTLSITGTPFSYNPAVGNLLLGVAQSPSGGGFGEFGFALSPSATPGGIFFNAMNGTAGSAFSRASGFAGTTGYGLVTTFTATPSSPSPGDTFLSTIKPAYKHISKLGTGLEVLGFTGSVLASIPALLVAQPELVVALLETEPILVGMGFDLAGGFDVPDPPFTFPIIAPRGPITPQIAADLQNSMEKEFLLATLSSRLTADYKAILLALSAGDMTTAASLESDFLSTLPQFLTLSDQQSDLYSKLFAELVSAGMANTIISPSDISSYLLSLQTAGFPSQEIDVFNALGFSNPQIDAIRTELLSIDTTGMPSSLFSFLDQATSIHSELAAVPEPSPFILVLVPLIGLYLKDRKNKRVLKN